MEEKFESHKSDLLEGRENVNALMIIYRPT